VIRGLKANTGNLKLTAKFIKSAFQQHLPLSFVAFLYSCSEFFRGVFGSLELKTGPLESEKIIIGSLESEKIGSLHVRIGYLIFSLKKPALVSLRFWRIGLWQITEWLCFF